MGDGYSGAPPPKRFNMAQYCLDNAAKNHPDKIGLVVLANENTEQHWTFNELNNAVRSVAGSLIQDGWKRGDRILLNLGNTSDYALMFFGAIAAGMVPVPTSGMLTTKEIVHIAKDAGIVACTGPLADCNGANTIRVYDPGDVNRMARSGLLLEYADTAANDPAFLIYTSGTTGSPKGVLHAQRAAWGRRPMYQDWYAISENDRVLHAGAFNWTYTLGTGLTDPWANGATAMVNTHSRNPSQWPGLIRETKATIFAAVPTLYRQILKYAPPGQIDLGDLRHGLTAGEALPESVASEWLERTGTHLHEALGMSEISTYISASPTHPAKPGTVGRPQTGRCVAILPSEAGTAPLPPGDVGLLAVHRSDPGLMIDYWNRPNESASVVRGEWFVGGDLASIDNDGNLTHHGRADDLMTAFGYRVSPLEVEQALAKTTGVIEVAVTEITVREDLRIIAAFAVCTTNDQKILDDLKAMANATLAEYKRPREYVVVDALPRTANGKIRRSELQTIYDTWKATA